MFENFNKLVKQVAAMERKPKRDLSIKLTKEELLEIDKSFDDYVPPKPNIAGWSFGWK